MSTHSFIGIIENNIIKGIYCHYDGYLSNNGKILFKYYQTDKKSKQLISLGSISYLGKYLNPDPRFVDDWGYNESNITEAYHRDHGEKLDIREFKNVDLFRQYLNHMFYDYIYLRYKKKWYLVKKVNTNDIEVVELKKDMFGDSMTCNFKTELKIKLED